MGLLSDTLIPQTPTISANMFTGQAEDVAQQMMTTAFTALDSYLTPIQTAINTIDAAVNTADTAYDAAIKAYHVAVIVSPAIAEKLRVAAEQAQTYRDKLISTKRKLDTKYSNILGKVEDMKQKVGDTSHNSIAWIEREINIRMNDIQSSVNTALNGARDALDKQEESVMRKAKEKEAEIEKKAQKRLDEYTENQLKKEQSQKKQKEQTDKVKSKIPKKP